mmetsp:Transcript_35428/g.77260  ORF Transcript_35428/g.77260 Transcript_35428/m.77260 type:complete len:83 (-) Transcript_35428:102-350(-)
MIQELAQRAFDNCISAHGSVENPQVSKVLQSGLRSPAKALRSLGSMSSRGSHNSVLSSNSDGGPILASSCARCFCCARSRRP